MTRRKGVPRPRTTRGCGPCWTRGTAVDHAGGQGSVFQADEVLQTSGEENLAMIAESVAFLVAAGPRGDLRRRALLRRLEARPPTTPCRPSRPRPRPGPRLVVLCDTNGGSMPEEIAAITRAAVDGRAGAGRHPLPQRLRPGGGQFAGRRRRRGRRRCRARSTASASAAATPT